MQRKQQVGECWVYVIFFACVCVGASGSTTASDDPSSSALCVVCVGRFLGGGGARYGPPWLRATFDNNGRFGAAPRIFFFGWFLLFLAVF
jgi:hypothetical protein